MGSDPSDHHWQRSRLKQRGLRSFTWIVVWGIVSQLVWGLSGSAASLDELYARLQQAVQSQEWIEAIEIVDQLIDQYPEHREDLEPYRRELVQLDQETQLAKLKILSVQARVGRLRQDRQQPRIPINNVIGLGPEIETTLNNTPESYRIRITIIGPQGIGSRQARIKATLQGGGEETIRSDFTYGITAVNSVEMIFRAATVSAPETLTVEIVGGTKQVFEVDLPSRTTVVD